MVLKPIDRWIAVSAQVVYMTRTVSVGLTHGQDRPK